MLLGLLQEAWISIIASRLRTFLAMLGIIIGVSSVVLMIAVGSGSQKAVQDAINKLGSNILIIAPNSKQAGGLRSSNISRLAISEAALAAQLPTVLATAPTSRTKSFQVAGKRLNWSTQVIGTTPDFFFIREWVFALGDSFTDEDVRLSRRVAVIGATVASKMFGEENPFGQILRINNLSFFIVGVLEAKGQGFDGKDQDDIIYVPITSAQGKLSGKMELEGTVQNIFVKVVSKQEMENTALLITELLRERRKLTEAQSDYFTIRDLSAVTAVASETTRALSILLGSIASISLLVGGIGIMNIMLVTVSERTREIGIRKAIGATENNILLQFLLEAIVISGVGSIFGMALGFAGGLAVEKWVNMPVVYSMWSVFLSLGVALMIGILSGIYPAHKAAKLQPIEALRSVGA